MELESEHTTFHRSSSSAASVLLLFVDFYPSVNVHVVGYGHQQEISQISIVSPSLFLRWEQEKKRKKKKRRISDCGGLFPTPSRNTTTILGLNYHRQSLW